MAEKLQRITADFTNPQSTTTELTSSLSGAIAEALGLSRSGHLVELAVRGTFFALNISFNGVVRVPLLRSYPSPLIPSPHPFPFPSSPLHPFPPPFPKKIPLTTRGQMWALYTQALARGTSTTQVAVMAVFSESLPVMWWAGAALLVAGNVIIGRKDEGKDAAAATETRARTPLRRRRRRRRRGYEPVPQQQEEEEGVVEDEDVADLGDLEGGRAR